MAILNQPGFANMAGAPQALQMAYMRDPRLRLAQQLQLQGADSSPVQHWTQGAARLAQALAGGYVQDKADAEYAKQAGDYQNDMRALYAPVQEMKPGQSGTGPRPDAQMTTRAPSIQEILARGQNLQSPYSQDQLRQFQMMDMQQQAAQQAEARKPFNLRPGERRMTPDGRVMAENPVAERPQAPPALVAEFQFAKAQGFPGSFMDYQRTRAESTRPQTNVSVTGDTGPRIGTIPPGFQLTQTPQGAYVMEPIPGGPAAIEAARQAEAKAEGVKQQGQSGNIVTQDIGRTVNAIDNSILPTTGFFGQMLSGVGGTGARDVAGLLDTIKANTAFDKLAEMRKASPTGAALGSVTERELNLLAAVRGNLEQSQSAEHLRFNLARLNNTVLDIVHGQGTGPQRMQLPGQQGSAGPRGAAPRQQQQPQAPALPQGVTPEMIQAEIARRGLGAAR
jgi:hypothetical protein